MNIKDLASGRRDMFMLDPKILVMQPGFNLREEGPDLDAYIESIAVYVKDNGVTGLGIWTIFMSGDDPVVGDGHCRTRGVLLAMEKYGIEVKSVPCRMMDKYSNEVDRISQMFTSSSGRHLTPMESSVGVKRLRNCNLSNSEIAVKIGKTPSYVGQLLELCGASPEIAEMINQGKVSATNAIHEIKKSPKKAKERLQKAIDAAKKQGKKKATKKHMDPSPAKPRVASVYRVKLMIETLNKEHLLEVQCYVNDRVNQFPMSLEE